jgi:hypothetical protein
VVSRLHRNAPLPEAPRARVDDPKVQRALDSIITSLEAVLALLQSFAQPEKWRAVTYVTGWIDADPLRFKKDPLGRVHFQGSAVRTSGASTVICVLPLGYRPRQHCSLSCSTYNGATWVLGLLDVEVDGRVNVGVGGTSFVALEGLSFDTEA